VIRLPVNRILAWLIDWALILGWAAIVAAVSVPLYLAGVTSSWGNLELNLVAALVLVLPTTIVMAVQEAGPRQATIGKRARRLRVVEARTGGTVTFLRALTRNAVKVAVPWLIGHAAVYAIVGSSGDDTVPPWAVVLTVGSYVLPISYVVSLVVGGGRTPYDWLSGTKVVSVQ